MSDLEDFVETYYRRWAQVLRAFDKRPLAAIVGTLVRVAQRAGTLWIAGNGGSAAIADHAACDLMNATLDAGWKPALRCVSMSANGPTVTALANDFGFEEVFRRQLVIGLAAEDAVLLVSASGNSPNVVNACRCARERQIPTIALVGFDGGELSRLADLVVWVSTDDYGMCEDAHQSVIHVLAKYIRTGGPCPADEGDGA